MCPVAQLTTVTGLTGPPYGVDWVHTSETTIILVFILIIYLVKKDRINKQNKRDNNKIIQ
jgi:hypothetical protein